MGQKHRAGTNAGTTALRTRLRPLRNILIAVVALSLYQWIVQGSVSWPVDAYRALTSDVGDYATRPGASWRQASEAIEQAGGARERVPSDGFDLRGRVVRVADGDTLTILDQAKRQHKIRLFGIDTPEREQAHGKVAREALSQLVAGKTVGVVTVEKDDYGRTVGNVYHGDTHINLTLVEAGHAWWYRKHARYERRLEMAEREAREQQRGLWAAADPVPPWQWRWEQRYE